MGDARFRRPYERLQHAPDRAAALRSMPDDDVVAALAAASLPESKDPYLANVLASEALNRLRRARAMVKHVREGLIALDPDGRCVDVNPAALDILGRSAEALRGRSLFKVVGFRDSAGQPVRGREDPFLRATHSDVEGEARIRRPDGMTRAIAYLGCPVIRDGGSAGAVIVIRDITDVSASRVRLGHEAGRHRALIEGITDIGLVLLSAEGVVESWNEGAHALLGYDASDVVGRHVRGIYLPADRGRALPEHELALAAREGRGRFDGSRLRADGAVVPVRTTLARIEDEGVLRGYAVAFTSPREWSRSSLHEPIEPSET